MRNVMVTKSLKKSYSLFQPPTHKFVQICRAKLLLTIPKIYMQNLK